MVSSLGKLVDSEVGSLNPDKALDTQGSHHSHSAPRSSLSWERKKRVVTL